MTISNLICNADGSNFVSEPVRAYDTLVSFQFDVASAAAVVVQASLDGVRWQDTDNKLSATAGDCLIEHATGTGRLLRLKSTKEMSNIIAAH